jgi:bacterioferritin-associated ferredoxin
MYVCICNAITEREVRECARRGARSLEELTFHLGVAAGCGRCVECACQLLKEAHGEETSLIPESIPSTT